MTRSRLLSLVGFALSLALLFWAFRDTDLRSILARARAADPWLLGLAIATGIASLPLRALRWRSALGHLATPPGVAAVYHATTIGALANNLLPARTGEVVSVSVCARLSRVGLATAATSLGVTHVVDIALLITLGGLGLLVEPPAAGLGESRVVRTVLAAGAVVALLAATAAFVLALRPELLRLRPERSGVRGALSRLIEAALEGLGALRNLRALLALSGWSLLLWSTTGLGWYWGLRSLGLDVGLGAAFLTQTVVAIGIALPSSPGFFGAFESAARIALSLYVADASAGAEAAVVFHLLVFFAPVILAGGLSILASGIDLADVRRSASADPTAAGPVADTGRVSGESQRASQSE